MPSIPSPGTGTAAPAGAATAAATATAAAAPTANTPVAATTPAAAHTPAGTPVTPVTDAVLYDASLVGRRVMATYEDEEGETQWYPATIVAHRPNARKYFFTVHYDADGIEIFVGLPDETVELLSATVTHCRCPRCLLADAGGRRLVS